MTHCDLTIIGAGPAGMTAAIYAKRAGLNVVLIEGQFPGGKMTQTDVIENWPGTQSISGVELATQMFEHTQQLNIPIVFNAVQSIQKQGDVFKLELLGDTITADACIIATGTTERKLGLPGETTYQGKGISYCAVCDGAMFKDKNVVVIGGGNSAFEDAAYVANFAHSVHLVLRRDTPRAEKILVDAVLNNPNIRIIYQYTPVEFKGDGDHLTSVLFKHSQTQEPLELACDGLFPMVGLDANTKFIESLHITDPNGFILCDRNLQTSIEGLYAAGDVRNTTLRQVVTAASDGARATQSALKFLDTKKVAMHASN